MAYAICRQDRFFVLTFENLSIESLGDFTNGFGIKFILKNLWPNWPTPQRKFLGF